MSAPYRDGCSRCVELEAELERLRGDYAGLYPNQGSLDDPQAEPSCVMCGARLRYQEGRNDWSCTKHEHQLIVESGMLWWKKQTVETWYAGCPQIPHLHRTCASCGASWVERPFVTGK